MAKAKVYFNIRKRLFSVLVKGRLVASLPEIVLEGVNFRVSQSGRARVLREKQKNVHAFVCGAPVAIADERAFLASLTSSSVWVTYNPYKDASFVRLEGEERVPIRGAEVVRLRVKDGRPCLEGWGVE